jgi:hypothetical protein
VRANRLWKIGAVRKRKKLNSQTLKRHVVKIKTFCHASESRHPDFYSVFTVFSGCHLAALRALAGMTAAFVFYLQDFKGDVFKTFFRILKGIGQLKDNILN